MAKSYKPGGQFDETQLTSAQYLKPNIKLSSDSEMAPRDDMVSLTDDGEDFGEGDDDEDDTQIVKMGDHKKVLKEIDTIYSTMASMRTMVKGVEKDLIKFKSRVGDDFSWSKYQEDRKKTAADAKTVQTKFEKDIKEIREKLAELEE